MNPMKIVHIFFYFFRTFICIFSLFIIFQLCICKVTLLHQFSIIQNIQLRSSLQYPDRTTKMLWFDKPSTEIQLKDYSKSEFRFRLTKDNILWQQATLPIGNGYLGANIFGEILKERVTFNDKTLWSGGPSQKNPDYHHGNLETVGRDGLFVKEIQKLFKEGKKKQAQEKCKKLVGTRDRFGSYLAFGELQFEFLSETKFGIFDYIRYLDLDTATSYVKYKRKEDNGDVLSFTREYFASYPDNVICIKFNVDSPHSKMTIKSSFIPALKAKTVVENNQISIIGELADNQMKFNGKMSVITKDGKIQTNRKSIEIKDATEVIFFITGATDYKNVYPKYRTGETQIELNTRVQEIINKAIQKGYDNIRKDHLKDYKEIFNRVEIDIGQSPSLYPLDELINMHGEYYKKSKKKQTEENLVPEFRYLEYLLFQYGRYLDIASSREGSLPPNLQGVWNDQIKHVQWESDYHININLQMNYFPTFTTNMARECGMNLLDFIESLQVPGRITAGIYTGIFSHGDEKNGFMAHTKLNPFGSTAPGRTFFWGWSPSAVLWILHNVYEIFLFTNDLELLRTRIYPLLKEESIYFEKLLIKDEKNDRLHTSPAFSPEQGPPTDSNTYEQTVLWQHFTNTLMAAKLLNVDSEYWEKWTNLIHSFKPIEIGKSGQIKEWYEETKLGSIGLKHHRHLSHLLGLYPFDLITVDNGEWLNAAKISLNDRGDESTGWAMGHRICSWARAGDGDRSFKLICDLIRKNIHPNLWDTHPPFQIDGNFAATAGIAEMFLQSTYNSLRILPALPKAWKSSGSFKGLLAKGNIVVSCVWKDGRATEVTLEPRFECDLQVKFDGADDGVVYEKEDGKEVLNVKYEKNMISFKTKASSLYVIKIKKRDLRVVLNTK